MLFAPDAAVAALSTFLRETEDGGAIDSRVNQATLLMTSGIRKLALYDADLGGFVCDPAIFAAAASHLAASALRPNVVEELGSVRNLNALRLLAAKMETDLVKVDSPELDQFFAAASGETERAWILLVSAHLARLKTVATLRPFLYPNYRGAAR
jgi:hypothetical protein